MATINIEDEQIEEQLTGLVKDWIKKNPEILNAHIEKRVKGILDELLDPDIFQDYSDDFSDSIQRCLLKHVLEMIEEKFEQE